MPYLQDILQPKLWPETIEYRRQLPIENRRTRQMRKDESGSWSQLGHWSFFSIISPKNDGETNSHKKEESKMAI